MEEQDNAKQVDATVQQGADPVKKKKMALWKKILLGFGIFIIGIFALAFFATKGASDAASQYIVDLQAGNCSEIYATSTNTFKTDATEEQWNDVCQRVSEILVGEASQKAIETNSDSGRDQTALATFVIDGNDGLSYEVKLNMINKDDTWQLNGFDSTAQQESNDGGQ